MDARIAPPPEPAVAIDTRPQVWRPDGLSAGERALPVEAPVAVVHDGTTYAVMMATPADLEDFALGFSLTEGVVASPGEVRRIEIETSPAGVEARMWLAPDAGRALAGRRRRLAGPTGCGLCGIDSLEEAVRPPSPLPAGGLLAAPDAILAAMASLTAAQTLNARTRAAHAAAFWTPGEGVVAVREDVGRHNALDKLAGALARVDRDGAGGAVLLTSRVSVEMVQKTAAIRAPMIVAVSAPTSLALETAQAAGVTIVAIARADGFEVFTHPDRVALGGGAP